MATPLFYEKTLFEADTDAVASAIAVLIATESGVNNVTAAALGSVVTLTYLSSGATNNNVTLPITLSGGATLAYSGAADFSGGVNNTDFKLTHNGTETSYVITNSGLVQLLSQYLVTTNKMIAPLASGTGMSIKPFFDSSGDWAFPVTAGTLKSFRVKVQILGTRID